MEGSVVFVRWRQCALPCGHIGATRRIRLNSCFLLPTQVHNLNGRLIGSADSAQLTAEYPCTLQWTTLSPKIAPSHGGSGPPSNTLFLEPIQAHNPNGISISSSVFAQMTADSPYTSQWNAPFSAQNFPFPWGDLNPHLIHSSLGQPESSTQSTYRSVQPFLQGSLV